MAPARKIPMRDPGEHIEAFTGAGDGLRHKFAGKPSQGHAVPGKSLCEVDIAREPPEMR